jgi:hypothetical protein
VGFVVDKVALGQVFFEYFGFPFQSSFHQFLHNHHHLSSGAGTIQSSSGRSTQSPTAQIKKKTFSDFNLLRERNFHILFELPFKNVYIFK